MEGSIAMKGGVGPTSYTQNSKFQAAQIEQAKALLIDGIQQNLVHLLNPNTATHNVFRIADLGCSVGPNTFACVQIIIEAVASEYRVRGLESNLSEFQVFFNDRVENDFNTLFLNLPSSRSYSAAGVPGSFHTRLFPRASIDVFNSAYALHWLTRVPDDVKNPTSPTWNKGRITYAESSSEVAKAYKVQFINDFTSFFEARSEEMADGALLTILMPGRQEGTAESESTLLKGFECLGHALMDMVKEGLVEEELVDSFNLPIFIPSASEVKEAASEVEGLIVEMVKEVPSPALSPTPEGIAMCTSHLRAVFEGMLCRHFGYAITDTVFKKFPKNLEKFSKTPSYINSPELQNLFMVIKKTAAVSI